MYYNNQDEEYGKLKEIELINIIRKDLNDSSLDHTLNKYSFIDFHSSIYIVELKSRRCRKNCYWDTMISKDKIDKMINDDRKSFIYFNFIDGLFNIEITDKNIQKFRLSCGGRCDRDRVELNQYYFIPVNMLKEVYKTLP